MIPNSICRRYAVFFLITLFATIFFPLKASAQPEDPVRPISSQGLNSQDSGAIVVSSNSQLEQDLQDVLHTINEIGAFIVDFWKLIKNDPLDGFKELFLFLGKLLGLIDAGDGIGELVIPGPGIGNFTYSEDQIFKPLGWVNHENGIPGIYPGRKPYGTNLAMMIDGYFFTLFAPDSGLGPGGFLFLDVANPSNPKLVKRVYEPKGDTALFREPHAFGLARMNGRRYMSFQNTIGIEIWDFTDLNNLERVSQLALPNVNSGDYSNVSWQLSWQAPYLYVASSEQGVFIVDVSDPAQPTLAQREGGQPNPIPTSELGGFRVGPLFTFGNQLVLSSMQNKDGVATLDLSDPLNPQLTDQEPSFEQLYYASCFNGQHLAMSVRGHSAKMVLFDLSDPQHLSLANDQLEVSGQLYCAFQDEYVFQGAEEKIHKIDISDPGNPVEVGSGTLLGHLSHLVDHGQVSPMGNLVFIGNDHGTGSAFMAHSTEPDVVAPNVLVTSPRNNATGQSTLSRIGVAFSDVVDFSTVNETSVRLLDDSLQPVAGIYSVQNNIVNFSPAQPLNANTLYRITVGGNMIKDVVGNTLEQPFTSQFTTGAGDNRLDVRADLFEETKDHGYASEVLIFGVDIESDGGGSHFEYQWNYGDGTVSGFSALEQTSHSYEQPGHYQVTLTIREGASTKSISFTKTVVNPPTVLAPSHTSTMSIVDATLYVVNPDNNTISSINSQAMTQTWEKPIGASPQTIASDGKGDLWVTLKEEDTIIVLNKTGGVVNKIKLPYGSEPYGIVFSPDKTFALASMAGSGKLIKLSEDGSIIGELPVPSPRAIAIDADSNFAWVTQFISSPEKGIVHKINTLGDLSLSDAIILPVDVTTIDSQDRARGVPNYLFDITISPDGQSIVVPSKKDNIVRGESRDGNKLDHDKTVRAILSKIDTLSGNLVEDATVDFDNRSAPRVAEYSPLGDYVYTALQGSNKVIVSDAYSGAVRVELDTGLAPQGMLITEDGERLWVHNFMSRSLSVFDISNISSSRNFSAPNLAEIDLVNNEQLTDQQLLGKQVFYNADDPRMSRESYTSCASCHVDGEQDGMVWDFTERGEGLRNTISMRGRSGMGHGNVHWTANFDEIQDFENDMRNGFGGLGFLTDEQFAKTADPLGNPKSGLSVELDALAAYTASLTTFKRSPYRQSDGSLTSEAKQGEAIFYALDCTTCHKGANLTDGERHILQTLVPGSGNGIGQPLNSLGIETPTLLGLWNSAPYFHHGQANTLDEVLTTPTHGNAHELSTDELSALKTFLKSLDAPLNVQQTNQTKAGILIRNNRWGCLGIEGSSGDPEEGATVKLQDCNIGNTYWLETKTGLFQVASDTSLCLTRNGKSFGWSRLYLKSCNVGNRHQKFYWSESGEIRVSEKSAFVIDAFGDTEGSKVGIWWNNGGENQQWY